jgi:hypothetical protein
MIYFPIKVCIEYIVTELDNSSSAQWLCWIWFDSYCSRCLKGILNCFSQLPKDDEILSQKLREEARAIFLQRRGKNLLNNNELKVCGSRN